MADTLIGILTKCTLNDVFVVFNLSYAKEAACGSRRLGDWRRESTKALFQEPFLGRYLYYPHFD